MQLVTIRVWVIIGPVWVVAIEVSKQSSGIWQHWNWICAVPSFTGRFVDVGDMEPADLNNIAVLGGHSVGCLCDVTADGCSPAVLGMQSITHKVKTLDVEQVGLVIFDMRLLETDNVSFLAFSYVANEVALCGRQPLDIELHNTQCWADGLKAMVLSRVVVER